MTRKPSRNIDVEKASLYSVIVNVAEIAVLVGFVIYLLVTDISAANHHMIEGLAILGSLMACWGAFLDVREALMTRRRLRVIDDLEEANTQMDTLNNTLRAQRHDFLNHLQVVYGLMEMKEYKEAEDYLEKVYGEILSVSRFLRTKSAAVNALLQVKSGACAEHKIELELDIKSALEDLNMPGWELCGVLANLIDNAIDALKSTVRPFIRLTITEDLRAFSFTILNNGPPIPKDLQKQIFEAGVSTKGEGRGMGLSIVRETLEGYGGTVTVQSSLRKTAFCVVLPKKA